MKCLCPAPDYINVPLPHGMTETIIVDWPEVEWLHGKKADRECVRCGIPICSDCGVLQDVHYHPFEYPEYVCPTCAEVER